MAGVHAFVGKPVMPTVSSRKIVTIACLAALTWARPVRGDLIYFEKGGAIQAPSRVEGNRVVVTCPLGTYTFDRSDIRSIVPGYDPPAEWRTRASRARMGNVDDRLAVIWWGVQNGLVREAVQLLGSAPDTDRVDPLFRRLRDLVARLDAPRSNPDTTSLRRALATPLESREGRLVVLLHQQDDEFARRRLELLDDVAVAFYLWFGFLGVELEIPRERLVAAHLRDREDYVSFLETQNAGAFRSTFGYFHPTHRAVVTYDLALNAPAPRPRDSDTAGERERRRLLRDAESSAFEQGTAAHEMVHLAVAASGLEGDTRRFPIWFHEGLATQFEVVRGGRWAGVGRAHDIRLADWRSTEPRIPLAALVEDQGFGRGYHRGSYAASWALVYHLAKTDPRGLISFIDRLRIPDSEEVSGTDRLSRSFRAVFGVDLAPLESSWRQSIDAVQSPSRPKPRAAPSREILTVDRIREIAKISTFARSEDGA